MAVKKATEIPTIDVNLITVMVSGSTDEVGMDTANKIAVEPQIDTEDAVKLVVKGQLKAQKGEVQTLTGNKITLTDTVFTPELVKIIQGGEITYDSTELTKVTGYRPPLAGSTDKGSVFTLNAYSAQYDTSGQIVRYEKISYPNCQGSPIGFNSEDGKFREPEYTIMSAPKTGEAPYTLTYVDTLPSLS